MPSFQSWGEGVGRKKESWRGLKKIGGKLGRGSFLLLGVEGVSMRKGKRFDIYYTLIISCSLLINPLEWNLLFPGFLTV